jgi:hypothetical protein
MKQSSKNRLMPRHVSLFGKETLFDKIARSVCRAGTLPRKELYEAWETARRVRRRYKGGRVVDLACGHGLLAHIMLILDKTSDHALCIDRKLPDNAQKLSHALMTDWPRLLGKIHFKEMDIQDVRIYPEDVVVSAHACGALTDLVIDKAVGGNARVAVLPCCHNLKTCPTGNLTHWMESTLAVDVVRAMTLQSRGYEILTAKIPDAITPKNRLLMGHPASPSSVKSTTAQV